MVESGGLTLPSVYLAPLPLSHLCQVEAKELSPLHSALFVIMFRSKPFSSAANKQSVFIYELASLHSSGFQHLPTRHPIRFILLQSQYDILNLT